MNLPIEVGITGGIGSGKSLVCRIFQCLGAPIYDADSRAKNLMTTDGILIEEIKKEFGSLSYQPDGSLDRAYLGKLVFQDHLRLEKLNSLVHPRIAMDYQLWVSAHKENKYLIREAALLFETGSYKAMGKMVVVYAPENIRMKRVRDRDPHRKENEIVAIMKNQWPDEEKIRMADYAIHNDDKQLVIPQVLHLHNKFVS